MAKTPSDSPLKVSADTKHLVRYGAAVFACTQGEFVERAVAKYLELFQADVDRRRQDLDRTRDDLLLKALETDPEP